MTALEFRDPPPPKKARRNWQKIADQLKANPGRWAVVASGPRRSSVANIASRINRNEYGVFSPVGAYEAVVRESEKTPGRFEAYAQFVGNLDGLS